MGRDSEEESFKQAIPHIGLSVERGTADVPSDGLYHVIIKGKEVYSSASMKLAVAEYVRLRTAILGDSSGTRSVDAAAILKREMDQRTVTSFLAESSKRKRAKATRRGGPGGSGGVAG